MFSTIILRTTVSFSFLKKLEATNIYNVLSWYHCFNKLRSDNTLSVARYCARKFKDLNLVIFMISPSVRL